MSDPMVEMIDRIKANYPGAEVTHLGDGSLHIFLLGGRFSLSSISGSPGCWRVRSVPKDGSIGKVTECISFEDAACIVTDELNAIWAAADRERRSARPRSETRGWSSDAGGGADAVSDVWVGASGDDGDDDE